jgi:hypothetical protein
MRSTRKRLTWIAAVATTIVAGSAAVAAGEGVQFGSFKLTVDAGFKPKQLPARKVAPIALRLEADFRMLDGTRPPALASVVLDFDKHGTVYTRGLPTCSAAELENATTADALGRCTPALVGRGTGAAVVDLPDQDAFGTSGRLLAFNGEPQAGAPQVILHFAADAPAPTTFVTTAPITDAPGKAFGKRVTIDLPPIAGGYGSLTHIDIAVERTWKHGGKRRSYVAARCTTGYLLVGGRLTFADGMSAEGSLTRTCRSRR